MSITRHRNIFSLGDYQAHQLPQQHVRSLASRRPSQRLSDPFESDPFKIQSYNFRYADRPAHRLQNLTNRLASAATGQQSKSSNASAPKQFETFYYNHDFATSSHDKENFTSTNRFHEHRRRKFLHDHTVPQQNCGGHPTGVRMPAAVQSVYQRVNPIASNAGSRSIATTSCASRGPTSSMFSGVVTPTTSPLLRSGSAREFMQSCRSSSTLLVAHAANTSSTDIANNLNTARNSPNKSYSRSSLLGHGNTDRCHANTFRYDGHRGSSSTTAIFPQGGRDVSHLRTSASCHNRRSQLSAKPSNANVNANNNDDACSGCHINININSMDTNPENLTINIDTNEQTASSQSSMLLNKPTNLNTIKVNGKDINKRSNRAIIPGISTKPLKHSSRFSSNSYMDLEAKASSNTFIIESRTSNTSLRDQRSVSNERIRAPYARSSSPITPKITKVPSKERIPGIVPWFLETKSKTPTSNTNRSSSGLASTNLGTPRNPNNDLSRLRCGYSSALNDIRNVKRHQQTEKRTTSSIAKKLMPERKLLNSILSPFDQKLHNTIQSNPLRRQQSHLSMTISAGSNRTRPSGSSQPASRSNPLHTLKRSATYHSCSTSAKPLNVNINVYADKLKMVS